MRYRFECTRCGNCCRRPGLIELTDDEVQNIARFLEITVYDLAMEYGMELRDESWWLEVKEGGTGCVFLDGDECGIQSVKPVQCRTYPFWPEIVLEAGAWEEEKAHCPGIGLGRPYSSAELEDILNRGKAT